jgi:hypothetical protein
MNSTKEGFELTTVVGRARIAQVPVVVNPTTI